MSKKKSKDKPVHDTENRKEPTDIPTDKFYVFPPWRMDSSYPWEIWSIGWLAIFKGVLWLSTSPNAQDGTMLNLMALKFVFCMIPFVLFGLGVWNFKKWAVWGLIILCVADLLFFIVFHPQASQYVAGKHFWILSGLLLLCNGPIGDILILIGAPAMIKLANKQYVLT